MVKGRASKPGQGLEDNEPGLGLEDPARGGGVVGGVVCRQGKGSSSSLDSYLGACR